MRLADVSRQMKKGNGEWKRSVAIGVPNGPQNFEIRASESRSAKMLYEERKKGLAD